MAEDGPLSQADIDALTAGLLGDVSTGTGIDTDALRSEADAILEQGSSVLGTLLNRSSVMSVKEIKDAEAAALADGMEEDCLMVRLPINQGLPGEICFLVRKETAALMCGLMMGGDGTDPFKDEDIDALNEFGNQFMGAVCTAMGKRHGVSVSAAQAQTSAFNPSDPPFSLDGAAIVEADLGIDGTPRAAFRLLLSAPLVAKLTGGSGSSGSGSDSQLDGFGSGSSSPSPSGYGDSLVRNLEDSPPNIQMLLDINLNVTIELGRTRLSIRKVLELGPGSIIELDRLAGEPVDLLVNDKVVAKGEVVVVDEYFGIRIISLVSPEERIKQLK